MLSVSRLSVCVCVCVCVYLCKDTENEEKLALTRVSIDEILDLQREEQLQRQHNEELKKKAMQERGLVIHSDPIQDDFFWHLCTNSRYYIAAAAKLHVYDEVTSQYDCHVVGKTWIQAANTL